MSELVSIIEPLLAPGENLLLTADDLGVLCDAASGTTRGMSWMLHECVLHHWGGVALTNRRLIVIEKRKKEYVVTSWTSLYCFAEKLGDKRNRLYRAGATMPGGGMLVIGTPREEKDVEARARQVSALLTQALLTLGKRDMD
jgi:hypothetical protein